MTPEIKQAIDLAAKRAATAAVRQTLLTLGIDASSPQGVQEMQQDTAFLRGLRRAASAKSAKYWAAIIALAIALVGALTNQLLAHFLHQGPPL